jgi:FkbM family methyltransferase
MTLPRVDLIRSEHNDWLLLNSPDHIGHFIRKHGFWGLKEVSIAKAFIQGRKNLNVLDVGANLGGFAVPVAKHLALGGGRLYAFEPQRIVFQQLCANIFINRLDNVYCYNCALADRAKELVLPELDTLMSQNIGGFSINQEIRGMLTQDALNGSGLLNKETGHVYKVEQRTLDSLSFDFDIDLIKVDIEGTELDFFLGGAKTIARSNFPPIIFELWEGKDWYEERAFKTEETLVSWGYKLDKLGREVLAQNPLHHLQCSIVRDGGKVKLRVS